jgi:hypothetical protein
MRLANSRRARQAPTGSGRSRLLALAATIAALAALAASPSASASRGQATLFDLGGVALDVTPGERAELLDQLDRFGVDTVRVIAFWREFVPMPNSRTKPDFDATNPAAYTPEEWVGLDDLIRGASNRGMNVLLTPSSPIPDWASPVGEQVTSPNASEFGTFVQALGTRYSGSYMPPPTPTDPVPALLPRVGSWSIWNEPNLTLFLQPQLEGRKSVSGRIYRELFLAAQRGLQASSHGSDQILIGETSPGPGRKGTDPVTFVRGVFCLNRKFKRRKSCSPIDADGWAQHPYDPFDAPFEENKGLINLATIGKLTEALNKARAAKATTRRLPVYVTEYGIESVPDAKFGVSELRQAEFIALSEYLMYRNGRIRSFGQYLMDDDAGNAQINFQTGLRFSDGREKLSFSSFPIALVAQRRDRKDRKVRIWGHVRPDGAPFAVTVNARPGGTVKRIRTNAAGYFQFKLPLRKGRRYSATTTLPDGTTLTGPFVRSYVFK